MKNFIFGSLFTTLFIYCIGSTYIIIKGVDKSVRVNRTNASTVN